MQSPFAFIRRWCITLLCWAGLVAGAVLVGHRLGPLYAYAAWAGIALLLCAAGAGLIRSQPLSTPTLAGRIGYQVVHFGFRASHGRLGIAALISWGVWCAVGTAAVWITHGWGAGKEGLRLAMGLSWCVNVLAIMYVWGIVLRNRPHTSAPENTMTRIPRSLLKLTAVLAGVTIAGGVLWFGVGTPVARVTAVIVTAAPALIVGGAYGSVLLVLMLVGKNVRWN